MLGAPGHVGGKALLGEAPGERLRDVGDVLVALALRLGDRLRHFLVGIGLEVLEREILELALEALHPEPIRQRRVDLQRLAGDPLLGLFAHELERPHIVDAIAELHEEHADVAGHRDDHFAEVLRLAVLFGGEVDLRQLGDAIDERGDLSTELLLDVVERDERVLDDVVEEPRADAGRVEAEIGDDARDVRRVDEIGVSRFARLAGVHPVAEIVRALDEIDVSGRLVRPHPPDQLFNLKHSFGELRRANGVSGKITPSFPPGNERSRLASSMYGKLGSPPRPRTCSFRAFLLRCARERPPWAVAPRCATCEKRFPCLPCLRPPAAPVCTCTSHGAWRSVRIAIS